jgi:hypothetical protein
MYCIETTTKEERMGEMTAGPTIEPDLTSLGQPAFVIEGG